MPKLLITGIALLMAVVSAAIFRKQATAKACPAHNQHAGRLATLVGWGLLIVSVGVFIFTWTIG
jgi:hypothetical protein